MNRTESILKLVPDIFSGKYKTVLYVGAIPPEIDNQFDNPEAGMAYLKEFKDAGCKITLVEIFKKNVDLLKANHSDSYDEIYESDIEDFIFSQDLKFDIVMWWHGPEHVEEKRLPKILTRLEKFGKVVIGCPWGRYRLGEVQNNPYQRHRSSLYADFFTQRGYEVLTIGTKDVPGSNLTAVK